eukprot:c32703_g1_i1.p1 GENE.c32703_g1_i1~~c32703_g1_i1.p1  ORF type:complete len:238 (-),score=48.97 c32703_g1_i1:28-720(-)
MNVTFQRADGTDVPGLLYGQQGAVGIVLIQEWWGLDFAIKAHADFLSSKGYRVIVPDLYRGELGVEAEEAQHLMNNLDWVGAIADIASAAAFLRSDGSPRVAAMGFCMGGALTIATAVHHPSAFECISPFYGVPPQGLADPSKLTTPIIYHSGENDSMAGFSSPAEAAVLEAQVTAPKQIVVVPGVGHAFLNATPEGQARGAQLGFGQHDSKAVSETWDRVFAWFQTYLA